METLKKMRMERRGSVLMETILVIPLYIAFFSGIYLLGDLELGRNRLAAADRFAVWLAGSRYEDKDDEAVKKDASKAFFPDGEFAEGTKLESFSSGKTKADWYSVVRGAAELKMVLPVWAVGCRKGAIQLFADIGSSPDKELWDKSRREDRCGMWNTAQPSSTVRVCPATPPMRFPSATARNTSETRSSRHGANEHETFFDIFIRVLSCGVRHCGGYPASGGITAFRRGKRRRENVEAMRNHAAFLCRGKKEFWSVFAETGLDTAEDTGI